MPRHEHLDPHCRAIDCEVDCVIPLVFEIRAQDFSRHLLDFHGAFIPGGKLCLGNLDMCPILNDEVHQPQELDIGFECYW